MNGIKSTSSLFQTCRRDSSWLRVSEGRGCAFAKRSLMLSWDGKCLILKTMTSPIDLRDYTLWFLVWASPERCPGSESDMEQERLGGLGLACDSIGHGHIPNNFYGPHVHHDDVQQGSMPRESIWLIRNVSTRRCPWQIGGDSVLTFKERDSHASHI